MFKGKEINTVYVSDLLKSYDRFERTCSNLIQIIDRHNISYNFIKSTKDIWCRDYMPIQTEQDKFIQFRYEPSYLKEELNLQSDTKVVCKANNINPEFSDKKKLIGELENLLNAEIIIIPQINTDITGHAD